MDLGPESRVCYVKWGRLGHPLGVLLILNAPRRVRARKRRSHRPKTAISFFIAPAGLRDMRMQLRKIREQHVAVNSLAGGSFWRRQALDMRRAEC